MTSQTTFYVSQILGKKLYSSDGTILGRIKDLLIDLTPIDTGEAKPVRPEIIAIKVKIDQGFRILDFSAIEIQKKKGKHSVICHDIEELSPDYLSNVLWLVDNFLDKQIVDINGSKVVRMNDIRLVSIPSGTYALAVDVGIDGLLRRLSVEGPIQQFLNLFGIDIPVKLILWDDIEAVDFSNTSIKLSKTSSKLQTLHPSDLADIIEELDTASRTYVFTSLDEEHAADVLEELEPKAQLQIIESLPVEKLADVLEKMPADEVADLLDELEEDRAEKLLNEMEKTSSAEVRELLEYPDNTVGSIMSTDFLTFRGDMTVAATIQELRRQQPDPVTFYSIFVVDKNEKLISSIPLGELIISDPGKKLKDVVKTKAVAVFDDDKIDTLAELVSKYNLLAVPVINKEMKMEGMVAVEDIVDDLLSSRKTT
ncbi:MAG: CBS domain-containing protein [Bacteroidetes bacterium]|nr:CBS domain-containing protein [Bacteroidota bacterium]